MKWNRFFAVLIGLFALLSFAAVHAIWSVARADLPQGTATQIYQPDFEEWAFLSLTASYRDYSSTTHFVSVARQTVNGKVRFKVTGTYAKSPAGQAWFDNIGSKIRNAIDADCKHWTAEGFPISLNDFQIEIIPSTEKPQ